ncbi:MAG TPA: nuclear transport factor 2 family protein [Candidatus Eremiobacteraceae bacterium]|nr:nuclear transport factor 2 family protein [Candidatus Eremiobacteraceae bacterium]
MSAILGIEDRLAILELLARADDAASRRDVPGYLALFTAEAVLDGAEGTHRGLAELAAVVPKVWAAEPSGTRHLTLNAIVDPQPRSDGGVTATSTLLIVQPGSPPAIVTMSAIEHELVSTRGVWSFRRRTVKGG